MLKEIFNKQDILFHKIFGKLPSEVDDEERMTIFKDSLICAHEELSEIARAINTKLFRHGESNIDNLKDELADLLHYFVQFARLFDLSAEDVHDSYIRKNLYNMTRVDHKSANKRTDV